MKSISVYISKSATNLEDAYGVNLAVDEKGVQMLRSEPDKFKQAYWEPAFQQLRQEFRWREFKEE